MRVATIKEAMGIQPTDKQMCFIMSQKKRAMFLGGFGSGKTWAGAVKTLINVIRCRGRSDGLLISPSFSLAWDTQAKAILDLDQNLFDNCGQRLVLRTNRQRSEIVMINGSRLLVRSSTRAQTSLRGINAGFAWMDESEACAHPEDTYQLLQGRLRCPNGPRQLYVTTTPQAGMTGVVALLAKQRKAQPENVTIVRASSLENPHLAPDFIEQISKSYSKARYRREILAELLSPAQSVFGGEYDKARHVIPWPGDKDAEWALGCDWGLNYPSFVVYEIHKIQGRDKPIYVMVDEYQPEQVSIEKQNIWLDELRESRTKPPVMVGIDRADTWKQGRMLRNHFGWRTKANDSLSNQMIMPGIEILRDLLDPRQGQPRLYFAQAMVERDMGNPRSAHWSFTNYSYHTDPNSGMTIDRVRKDNITCHQMDSSRYVLTALERAHSFKPQIGEWKDGSAALHVH